MCGVAQGPFTGRFLQTALPLTRVVAVEPLVDQVKIRLQRRSFQHKSEVIQEISGHLSARSSGYRCPTAGAFISHFVSTHMVNFEPRSVSTNPFPLWVVS